MKQLKNALTAVLTTLGLTSIQCINTLDKSDDNILFMIIAPCYFYMALKIYNNE